MHDCEEVIHAFFTSYVHIDDFSKLRDMNVPLFENFIDVIGKVYLKLGIICLQTGERISIRETGSANDWPCSQHYGAHIDPVPVPLTEKIPRSEELWPELLLYSGAICLWSRSVGMTGHRILSVRTASSDLCLTVSWPSNCVRT